LASIYKVMKVTKIRRIFSAIVLVVLASCQLEQPMDPGEDLFSDIFSFQQVTDSTLYVEQGIVDVDWGSLQTNPVGISQGYEALSLLKFTDFSFFDDIDSISVSDVDSVKLVLPVIGGITGETDTTTSVGIYEYLVDWDESIDASAIDTNQISRPATGIANYPADLDTSRSPISLISSLDVDLVKAWVEDSTTNNGVMLKATGDSVMLFITYRRATGHPFLQLYIGEETYSVGPDMDFGVFRGGDAPEPSDSLAVVEQAHARRITLHWEELFEALPTDAYYIHSARLTIPLDQSNTRGPREEHPLTIAVGSGEGVELQNNPTTITKLISDTTSALVIESNASDRFLRDYLQSIINGSLEASKPLVFYYSAEAFGVQYTTFLYKQASLDVIYSVVENE